jgi:hypothetical protein
MNKPYVFNIGWDKARDGDEEPEWGRFGGTEINLWWAGWHSWYAGLPRMHDEFEDFDDEPF